MAKHPHDLFVKVTWTNNQDFPMTLIDTRRSAWTMWGNGETSHYPSAFDGKPEKPPAWAIALRKEWDATYEDTP